MRIVCIGVKDLMSFESCSYRLAKAIDDIISRNDKEVQRIEVLFEPEADTFSIIVGQLDRSKQMTGRDIEAVSHQKLPDAIGLEDFHRFLFYRIGQLVFGRGWMVLEHISPLRRTKSPYGFVLTHCE